MKKIILTLSLIFALSAFSFAQIFSNVETLKISALL